MGGIYGVIGISVLLLFLIVFILKKIVFQEKAMKNILRQPTSKSHGIQLGKSQGKEITPKTPKKLKKASFHSHEPW